MNLHLQPYFDHTLVPQPIICRHTNGPGMLLDHNFLCQIQTYNYARRARDGATGYARYALAYPADPACIRVYILYLEKPITKEHLPVAWRTKNERNASSSALSRWPLQLCCFSPGSRPMRPQSHGWEIQDSMS